MFLYIRVKTDLAITTESVCLLCVEERCGTPYTHSAII